MAERQMRVQSEGENYQNRLTGLRFPRHILDADAEPLCGIELSDDHQRLLEKIEPEDLATVHSLVDENGIYATDDYCGNCLRVYLSRYDDEELERKVEEYRSRLSKFTEVA